jgi:type II secretory pathway component PulM
MKSKYLPILLLLLIALSYSFWIKPQSTKISEQKTELQALETELASITGSLERVETTNISNLDAKLVEQAIPKGYDQDKLILIVKDLADEYKINVLNLSFSQSIAEQSNQIKSTQIGISAQGAPGNVKLFLAALENNNRGFFVKNIGLNYGTVEGIDQANLNLTIEAYFS